MKKNNSQSLKNSRKTPRKLQRKIRYAVVGLGHIAQVAALPAFKQTKYAELTAFVSGDATKLKKLSKKYGVKHLYSYEEYDDCLYSDEIDAVYIALPNRMHSEFAERALDADVHVLCEKPLAVSVKAAERAAESADESTAKSMVGYRLHFDPTNLRAIQTAHDGTIGEIRYMSSEFGYQLKDGNIRGLPEEGGSPLHDIGIYCINAARYLFKAEPIEVFAFAASPDFKPKRILQTVSAQLRFPGDRLASFTCSFNTAPISNYRIVGTRGDLFVENAYDYVGKMAQTLTVDEKSKTKTTKIGDQFAAEIDYFSHCILNNLKPEPSFDHGAADVKIIQALMESIEIGRPVRLGDEFLEPSTVRRPTRAQEIRRPPHREPKLVKVASASK